MKLPNPIEFEVPSSKIFKTDKFVIEFVEYVDLYGRLFKLEIYNKDSPAFRIRGDWMPGCCIEDVKEEDSVDHILTAAENALFKAVKDDKIIL